MSEREVLDDLRDLLNRAAIASAMASGGLARMHSEFKSSPRHPENPDPWVYVGRGDPNEGARYHAGANMSDLLRMLEKGGEIDRLLGHQWVTYVFSAWEHEFRPRLAAARGAEVGQVRSDEFGDLRLIRHDILHHHGVATDKNSGRCKVLGWFAPGDNIYVTDAHQAEFYDRLGLTGDIPRGGEGDS